jgi:hypothetical protein
MRTFHASTQLLAGGELQVIVAHGSPAHALPAQPNWHVESVKGYWQLAPEQVPAAWYVRRTPPEQLGPGGVLHGVSMGE